MSIVGTVIGNLGGRWRLYAELAVVGVLVAFAGVQSGRLVSAKTDTAEARQQLSDERAAAARAALAATQAARTEESRRAAAQTEIAHEAQRIATRARADGVVADAAHRSLSDRADVVARRCTAAVDPPAAARSAPAADPGLLLADVLKRADERAGDLAAFADQASVAGAACERAYEALTR